MLPNFERFQHECGLIRLQAVTESEEMLDRIDSALGVATRHLDRISQGILFLSPAVEREIEQSLERARHLLGIGSAKSDAGL